jgi:cysteinyl-tRNA synthetase
MDDDLNTPQALAALFDLGREINRSREQGLDVEPARLTLLELAGVLGLRLDEQAQMGTAPVGPLVELLIQVRDELRSIRQYALADRIRDRLHDLGIDLEDTSQGTQWRRRSSP